MLSNKPDNLSTNSPLTSGSSLRFALKTLNEVSSAECIEHSTALAVNEIADHFANNFATSPAIAKDGPEPVVRYRHENSNVLLGFYGCEKRLKQLMPSIPDYINPITATELIAQSIDPQIVSGHLNPQLEWENISLRQLPVLQATPSDAGPYITMGFVYARDDNSGQESISAHRMLLIDDNRLAIWMLPSRQLRALYQRAAKQGKPLPVTINIGVPPAVALASTLSGSMLPEGASKLSMAGALAQRTIRMAPARTQKTLCLADSEIVLEGEICHCSVPESVNGDISMPEFLGYFGSAQQQLPVVKITGITSQQSPLFQATIGPGKEQSIILGIGGALNAALAIAENSKIDVVNMRYAPAGGGMLLLYVSINQEHRFSEQQLTALSKSLIQANPFTKLIIYVDQDINIDSDTEVLWAMLTRSRLGQDCHSMNDFSPLPMDPSQKGIHWRGKQAGEAQRTFINATAPFDSKTDFQRSF